MSFLSIRFSLFIVVVSMWDAKREINKCGRSTRCTQNCFRLSTSGLLSKLRPCRQAGRAVRASWAVGQSGSQAAETTVALVATAELSCA